MGKTTKETKMSGTLDQIIVLYILNLENVICQLRLNKRGKSRTKLEDWDTKHGSVRKM